MAKLILKAIIVIIQTRKINAEKFLYKIKLFNTIQLH